MMWEAWVLFLFFILQVIVIVTEVDKPREPIRHNVAAIAIVIAMVMAWLVMRLGGAF